MTFEGLKIIAEVGSNWRTFEDAKNSIALAKACGADAVKFQLFDQAALYGIVGFSLDTPEGTPPYLNPAWLPKLKAKADACGIEFMCSAFSPELIDAVDPYVSTHKLASAEMSHVRMLEKLRAIGKPVIMSTGGHTVGEIKRALYVLADTPVCVLYCVSEYPARNVNFVDMELLATETGKPVGFSDHTTDMYVIPFNARFHGACVIEKHVNLVGATNTPDAPHSLTLNEFKGMCQALKGGPFVRPSEDAMRTTHNRRLIAIKDIAVGETLKEAENFGIYRSLKAETKALAPWSVNEVNGRVAKQAIKAGEGIGPFDV